MPTIEYRCSACRRPFVREVNQTQMDKAMQHAAEGRPFVCKACDGFGGVRMRELEGTVRVRGAMILDDEQ